MNHPIWGDRRPTRDEAIRAAGEAFARVLAELDAKSPRQAAEDACRGRRGGPTVDQVADLIRHERGLPPKHGGTLIPKPKSEKPARRVHRKKAPAALAAELNDELGEQ